jgi:phage shock protein B
MSDNVTAVLLAFFVIVLPVWITFHYAAKWRAGRRVNASDAAAYEQLSQTASRMEVRMATLERILDAEVPAWRREYSAEGDVRNARANP